jgi:hypothetical protein
VHALEPAAVCTLGESGCGHARDSVQRDKSGSGCSRARKRAPLMRTLMTQGAERKKHWLVVAADRHNRGEPNDRQYLIAASLVSACAVTASAQTTTEYYVVQDSATKKCTIVDKKPTTSTIVQVGPMVFKTRTEAEAEMKTITVCSSN